VNTTPDPRLISIVMASDNRCAMPLTVAAYSAMKNLKDHQANLFILDGGIAAAGRRKIRQSIDSNQFRIHWVRPASARLEVMHRKSENRRYPLPAYFRLLLPEILPQDIYKVIYLDTDTIVLKDLAKLWEIDTEDYHFLAVQEPDGPYVIDCFRAFNPELKDLDFSQFQVTPEHKYFNSGVMVINIQKWRQDGVAEKALNFLELYFPKYADQDALNVVSAGQWRILDPRWNTTQAFYEKQKNNPYSPEIIDQVVRNPFIIHYTGQAKPWGTGGVRSSHPRADLFFKYGVLTAWAWGIRRNYWLNRARGLVRPLELFMVRVLRKIRSVARRLLLTGPGA
jgi:lipopolysaccharide biosynthesis glycosyltransferase